MLSNVNNSCIHYQGYYGLIDDYYHYIVKLIVDILKNNNISINIILGNDDVQFAENQYKGNKTIRININYEHTLVKVGGRDTDNCPIGKIKLKNDDSSTYLVRIDRYNELNCVDIVIDYSNPNIKNVVESGLFNNFSKKMIYISPAIFYGKENEIKMKKIRDINILTTFINTNEPRRKRLLDSLSKENVGNINVNNCFDKNELEKLYKRTKIMVNIHQTDHHHTFEELRVLPALQNGIVVIAELSPLSYLVPYYDMIIWTDYDNIVNKVIEVSEKYDMYHGLIFNDLSLKNILNRLDEDNYDTLEKKIMELC